MSFDIIKFLGGFAIWRGKVIGKLLYYLVIITACLFVFWKLFVAPTTNNTSHQKADQITNITQVRNEEAFELNIIPPSVKVGGFKLRLFKEK